MKEDNFMPFFINLNKKKVLVIGAGKIAYRKVNSILSYGAEVTVISKEILLEEFYNLNINIMTMELFNNSKLLKELLNNLEIDSYFMVVAATSCKSLNNKIVDICQEKNILVNNITSQENMNLRFGKELDCGSFKIGISGKGDPKVAKEIENKLVHLLKEN